MLMGRLARQPGAAVDECLYRCATLCVGAAAALSVAAAGTTAAGHAAATGTGRNAAGGVEAWRRRLLAMQPWQLMQQFGMTPARVRKMLSDPQTATLLFHQNQGDRPGLGSRRNRETSGMGSASDRAMREADMMRAGYVDNFRDFVGAVRSGIRAVTNPIGTGVASMVENAAGVAPGTYGGMSGNAQRVDMNLENAVRSGRINPQTGRAWTRAEAMAQQSRSNAEKARGERNERDRAASRGAGPGGRGPRGGGAYGGMGGVGSHGV